MLQEAAAVRRRRSFRAPGVIALPGRAYGAERPGMRAGPGGAAGLGAAVLLRAGLVVEALCQLSLALTRRPWVAGATLVLFGAHAMVWGGGDGVAAAAGRARPAAWAGQQRVFPVRPRRGRARHAGRRVARPGVRHHRTVLAGVRGHGAARRGGSRPRRWPPGPASALLAQNGRKSSNGGSNGGSGRRRARRRAPSKAAGITCHPRFSSK